MEVLRNSVEDFKKPWPKPPLELDHSLTKENLSPGSSLHYPHSSQNRLPLRSNSFVGNLPDSTPAKCGFVGVKSISSSFESQEPRCYDLDSEIEAIEKEISRLSTRLEYLRIEKTKQVPPVKTVAEKRGRFVPAKFMDPPPEKPNPRMTITPRSRGLSMLPSEIARGLTMAATATPAGRRGISLGPAEIYSATRSKLLAKQQAFTPIYESQSRRKSCFWKLQEVDELKVIKERGKSMSMSPKSRKIASKLQSAYPKQALTSIGAAKNKSVKKEDTLISSIQPKKLFKDIDKSAPAKKPVKAGRTVPSRYNKSIDSSNSAATSSVRKRSLPENDKEIKICDKKRISLSGKSEAVTEISSGDDPLSVTVELEMLPKIRTLQSLIDSPRDSGPAKRVVDLVKRRSHFSLEEDEREDIEQVQPASACKALSFEEEEEEEEEVHPTVKSILSFHSSSLKGAMSFEEDDQS